MKHLNRYDSILDLIGKTPMVRLRKMSQLAGAKVYAKMEAFNPGQSVKDRIVYHMINRAEMDGKLTPGSTIIEATSGNTGFSVAMISAMKGYDCILTVKDSASSDKIKMMRALGATVVKCPAKVPGDHPDSYYSKAKELAETLPGSYYLNQNFDKGNSEAHYLTTGPEIWEQSEGRLTHFVATASTGGTISGAGKFLKERSEQVQIIAVDSEASALKTYHEKGVFVPPTGSSSLEGVGKNIIPANVNFDTIDRFISVSDRSSSIAARYLAKTEGIMAGYSSGAVMAALWKIRAEIRPDDFIVVLFPDHGSRYLSKIYDPKWLLKMGYLSSDTQEDSLDHFGADETELPKAPAKPSEIRSPE